MIQVVERIGGIITFLSKHEQGISLLEIEKATGLNKGTSCNLLKSLISIGFVEKCGIGIYRLGPALRELAYPQFISDNFIELANEYSLKLSDATRESGLAAVRDDGKMKIVARHIYDQSIIINSQMFTTFPIHTTAVGYIFMAFDNALDIREIFHSHLTRKYKSFDEFSGELEDIRSRRYHLIEIPDNRHAHALAAPVFRGDKIACSICTIVPNFRFPLKTRNEFIRVIKRLSAEASTKLSTQTAATP